MMSSGIIKSTLAIVFLVSLVYASDSEAAEPEEPEIDISVTMKVSNSEPKEGEEITYTITVANVGKATPFIVVISDDLPEGLEYIKSVPQGIESEGDIGWILQPIAPGSNAILTVTVTVNGTAGDTITNTAGCSGGVLPPDENSENDESNVAITVQQDEPYLEIEIDIKPGNEDNSINLKSNGVIPVAILTTSDFDALTVDPLTVRFGKTGTEAAPMHEGGHVEDVDKDGDNDLLFHFGTQDTGLQEGDTEAYLTGKLLAVQASTAKTFSAETAISGQAISGCDSIKTSKKAPELRFAGKLATTWGDIKNRY